MNQHMSGFRSSCFEIIGPPHHHTFSSLYNDDHILNISAYQRMNTPILSAQTTIFTPSYLEALASLHIHTLTLREPQTFMFTCPYTSAYQHVTVQTAAHKDKQHLKVT
jgi:hypothetical protein